LFAYNRMNKISSDIFATKLHITWTKNEHKYALRTCYTQNCLQELRLWSSGQSSLLHIQRFGFDSRRYLIFWEVVGLERGRLSLVSTTKELVETKSSGSGLENRNYGRKGSAALTMRHPSIRKSQHKLSRQAAVARLVWFASGFMPQSFFFSYSLLCYKATRHFWRNKNIKFIYFYAVSQKLKEPIKESALSN
jgi:hypothetical protein